MSLTRKVAYNTIIQVIGKVITTLISLVLVAALTRYLGVAGYGQYTTIFAYVAFFGVLADFGFFWILVREIAKPNADVNRATSNVLTLRIVIGIIFYGLAALVALFIPQYADFRAGIAVTALASLFLALNSTYIGVFQNKLRMDKAALTDVIGRAIILCLTLYLIKLGLGLNAILWAYAIGNIINFFMSAILGQVYVNFRLTFDFPYWKELFWQALPMGIVLILSVIYFKIDTVMLSLLKTSTDVGIYGPPYKVLEIVLLLPVMFMGNVFPIITKYLYDKDERLTHALQKSFDFLIILGFPIIMGVIFTAPRIIKIVAGSEFLVTHTIPPFMGLPSTSPSALQILIIAAGLSFLTSLFGYLIIALGKQAKLIAPYIFLVFFNIGINLILIPKYSYMGAAVSTVLTEFLVLLFSWYIAHKYVDIKFKLNIVWQSLVATLVLSQFLYFFGEDIHLLILVPLSAILYGISLYLVGGINKDMLGSLTNRSE